MKDIKELRHAMGLAHASHRHYLVGLVAGVLLIAGCSQDVTKQKSSADKINANVDGSRFLLTAEPSGVADVIKVRETAKDSDEVVVVGRIGGSENPWVDGRAAFSIVDLSLKSCLECGSEGCLKPWDYC